MIRGRMKVKGSEPGRLFNCYALVKVEGGGVLNWKGEEA